MNYPPHQRQLQQWCRSVRFFLFSISTLLLFSHDASAYLMINNPRRVDMPQLLTAKKRDAEASPRADFAAYKFVGSGSQMEQAIGVKRKRNKKSNFSRKEGDEGSRKKKSSVKGKKKSMDDDSSIPIELLEKQVIMKYASNDYKFIDEDDSDDDLSGDGIKGISPSGRFEGFGKHMKGNRPSLEDDIHSERDSLDDEEAFPSRAEAEVLSARRKQLPLTRSLRSRLTKRLQDGRGMPSAALTIDEAAGAMPPGAVEEDIGNEDLDIDDLIALEEDSNGSGTFNEEGWGLDELITDGDADFDYGASKQNSHRSAASRFGPINAVDGYRLRPPPPVDPAIAEREAQRAAAAAEKEAAKREKRRRRHEEDRDLFTPFTFKKPLDFDVLSEFPEAAVADESFYTSSSFEDLGIINEAVLQNMKQKLRVHNPSSIQAEALPIMLSPHALRQETTVIVQAQTGSGKTLAYLLPLLRRIDSSSKKVQALIFAPSRELVTQIGQVATKLFLGTDYRVLTLIGGANVNNQMRQLRDNRPQLIVATPGRLAEIVFRLEKLKLGAVNTVIIDEVDNMLRDPYVGEVETVLQAIPSFRSAAASAVYNAEFDDASEMWKSTHENTEKKWEERRNSEEFDNNEINTAESGTSTSISRLFCLASATANDDAVVDFAMRYSSSGKQPLKVAVKSSTMLPRAITHGLISTPRMRALQMLKKFLVAEPAVQSALIFVNDPYRVQVLAEQLLDMGFIAAPLHGDTSKDDRKDILARMRDGRLRLVVTTELAARGLDIPFLTHVINFELPTDAEHYVHRAGRCGRAGREGLVMNFANPDTKFVIRRFGKKLGVKVLDCELRGGEVFLKQK